MINNQEFKFKRHTHMVCPNCGWWTFQYIAINYGETKCLHCELAYYKDFEPKLIIKHKEQQKNNQEKDKPKIRKAKTRKAKIKKSKIKKIKVK